jgi:hypothetical protein
MGKNIWFLVPVLLLFLSVSYLFSLREVPEEAPSEHLGWIESTATPQGIVFSYPRELEGSYYFAAEWPPIVERVVNEYSCSNVEGTDGPVSFVEERSIDGKLYCISERSEGAAGSRYTTYEYSTDRGDAVMRTVFTIRFPQCLNYDNARQEECEAEQSSFDPDDLAKELIDSARLP